MPTGWGRSRRGSFIRKRIEGIDLAEIFLNGALLRKVKAVIDNVIRE